jgi:hypothetical protein
MKTKAPQFELPAVSSEVFNLAIETAVDGERLRQEMEVGARHAQEAKEIEKKQQPNLI